MMCVHYNVLYACNAHIAVVPTTWCKRTLLSMLASSGVANRTANIQNANQNNNTNVNIRNIYAPTVCTK